MMASEFERRIRGLFTSSCTALGIGLGVDLGLFQAMVSLNGTFTSEELARAADCKERYIREWLGIMACSDIVGFDDDTGQFQISREKLTCLIGQSAEILGAVPILGLRQSLLKDCFKKDGPGGIYMNVTPEFGVWLDSLRDNSFPAVLDDMILGDANMKEKLASGICVADVGSGAGKMAIMIAERFPNSTVWALDIDLELLNIGKHRATRKHLDNIHFEVADVHKLSKSWTDKFDYIFCFDVIHDIPFPRIAIEEIYKSLRPGGVFSMVEPNVHSELKDNLHKDGSTENYTKSLYTCLPHALSTPKADGWGRTMGKERAVEFLENAGFKDFSVKIASMNHFICPK